MNAALVLTIGISLCVCPSRAQPLPTAAQEKIRIARSGTQPPRPASADHFTGAAWVDSSFQASPPARISGARVQFDPGSRTAWHVHPLGQTLLVTAGTGRVQRWGDPVDEIRPGDVIWIPPGQKHWHGAAPHSSMTHIAITEQLDGKTVEWLEKVSDAQYAAPLRASQQDPQSGDRTPSFAERDNKKWRPSRIDE